MNETAIVYIVHSDLDENNIFAMFEDEVEAIMYARKHKEDLTYVDKTEMSLDESGDYDEVLSAETIWVYDEDIDPEDIEDEPELSDEELFSIDFDELERELDDEESWFEDLDTDKLVETLEENEDIVECKECFELFPKEACTKIAIGYICPECGKIHSHEEPEFEIDSIPDVVIADEDTFKIDFPELERTDYGNDMIPDEPTPEVGPNPEPMSEPCVGPECEAPVEAPVTKDETITKLVIDEHEAIDGYDKAKIEIEANSELDEKEKEEILDTIEHIKEEEIEHIEELEELVDEAEETKANEPAEESKPEDETEVLVETSVAIPDFRRRSKRKNSQSSVASNNNSQSSYVFNYTAADFEALSHHLNLAYKRATTTPKISAATLIYPFKLYSQWNSENATAYAIEMFTSSLQDCNTLEDIEIKLDPFFDYLGTESEYKNDIEFYDEVVSNFANALWELKTGAPVDKEGLDEELINNNADVLTEASIDYGKGWKVFTGEQTKLDVLFSDKESPSKNGEKLLYGNGYKLCIYNHTKRNDNFGIEEITDWGNYKLSNSANDYNEIGAAKKDVENLSKQLKDKTIGICINDYEGTNHPYLYLFKDGKQTVDYAKDKINQFEKKFETDTSSTKPTEGEQQENSTVTWSFATDNITIEVGANSGEASIDVYKNGSNVTDKDFKDVSCAYSVIKGLKISEIIKTTKNPGGSVNLTVEANTYNELSPEIKEKLANGVTLWLNVKEGGSLFKKASCTIKVTAVTEQSVVTDVPVEQPPVENNNTQEPTQEELQKAYELLIKKFKHNEVKKYVRKFKNNTYQPGPNWSDFKKKEQEITNFINFLGESLTEETHAQYAKPEGNRIAAYNNALKYAKQYDKPFIYGYTNHTGKFFAAEIPMKVTGSPAEAEKEFRSRYKNCSVIYVVYPDKDFVTESLFTKAEQEEYNMDEDGNSLDSYDTYIRCGFCDEIYTKSECKYERNLSWLCPSCEAAIYSRGEKLTFVDPDEFLD